MLRATSLTVVVFLFEPHGHADMSKVIYRILCMAE